MEKLKRLEKLLEAALDTCGGKELPAVARQYRETLREIEAIEGGSGDDDEIGRILSGRAAKGKPDADRKGRATVPDDGRS